MLNHPCIPEITLNYTVLFLISYQIQLAIIYLEFSYVLISEIDLWI